MLLLKSNFLYHRHLPQENNNSILLFLPVHLQRPTLQQLYKEKQQTSMVRHDTQLRSRQEMGLLCLYVILIVLL